MGKLRFLKTQIEAGLPAQQVAAKTVGRYGLFYITIIVMIGVGASLWLDESKIAAVIGLVSAALTGIISMLAGVAETQDPFRKDSDPPPPVDDDRYATETLDQNKSGNTNS